MKIYITILVLLACAAGLVAYRLVGEHKERVALQEESYRVREQNMILRQKLAQEHDALVQADWEAAGHTGPRPPVEQVDETIVTEGAVERGAAGIVLEAADVIRDRREWQSQYGWHGPRETPPTPPQRATGSPDGD